MNILIIEDEVSTATALMQKIHAIRPEAEIVGHTTNIKESVRLLKEHPEIDIVFSDIKIDDGLSFSIFEQFETQALIVFTTAFDAYAIKAFDYNCVEYLLKPISNSALEKAFIKCERKLPRISPSEMRMVVSDITAQAVHFRERIFLECGRDMIIARSDEICYVVVAAKALFFQHCHNRPLDRPIFFPPEYHILQPFCEPNQA